MVSYIFNSTDLYLRNANHKIKIKLHLFLVNNYNKANRRWFEILKYNLKQIIHDIKKTF